MDHALTSSAPVDRRTLACLVIAGVTGAEFAAGTAFAAGSAFAAGAVFAESGVAESGVPVNASHAWAGPVVGIDTVRRTLAVLAAGYDTWGPLKVEAAVKNAEEIMRRVFTAGVSARLERDAHAVYGQLLLMDANTALDTGRYRQAERTAKLSAGVALKAGDDLTAGRAWATVSASLRNAGRPHHALVAARRARAHAGGSPAAVMAFLDEALACARISRVNPRAVLDSVTAAEKAHAMVPSAAWGAPGYSFGVHPADLRAHAGAALAGVGLYAEADARLGEAIDILVGADGIERVYVRLLQARVAIGTGGIDAARDFATEAVASAQSAPAAWVARIVGELDRYSHPYSAGAFADLVEQTSRWGFATV